MERLAHKSAVKVAYWKVVVSHPRRDNITFIMLLNAGEVPNGTTAGSKQVGILGLAVQVPHSQGYDPSLLFIKGCPYCVDTRFNASTPLSSAKNLTLKWLYHIAASLECCRWVT